MGRKIKNLIAQGMPSKIYAICYRNEPITGYAIAQKIYGISQRKDERRYRKSIPPTAKVYGWLKKLTKKKIVRRKKDGYISNAKPLLEEMEKRLAQNKSEPLSIEEKQILLKLIDSSSFRCAVSSFCMPQKFDDNLNASNTIMSFFSFCLPILTVLKSSFYLNKYQPKTIKEFNEIYKKFIKRTEKKSLTSMEQWFYMCLCAPTLLLSKLTGIVLPTEVWKSLNKTFGVQ